MKRISILALALAAGAWVWLSLRGERPWTPPVLKASDFLGGIPVPHDRLRLIVSALDVHKSVLGESSKSVFGVDLGTTKVALSMPARIHYAIDLSGERPVEFKVYAARRELVAIFPDPKVEAVELLTARKRVAVETGWGRLKSHSGRSVEDELERGLYDVVKADGSSPAVLEQIKERARPLLARLLNDYLLRAGALGPEGVVFTRIRFKGDAEYEPLAMLPRDVQ